MDTLSQDSLLECQICFNYYSPRRRPKLLDCRHTCCSVCLSQMRCSQKEIRCPWCRGLTWLPAGLPVSHLPDDPDVVAVIAIPHAAEHTPVFIRLPGSGCYVLPLAEDKRLAAALVGVAERQQWRGAPQQQQPLALAPPLEGVALALEGGEGERRAGGGGKGSTWSGVCTVILVACVLLFLLAIVLHNMSCISKRLSRFSLF